MAPVREIIDDGKTGFLVDFLKPDDLVEKTIDVLSHHSHHHKIGKAARAHIVEHYDFHSVVLKKQLKMINTLLPIRLRLTS